MKGVLLFFLMIVVAVFLGLVIALWYLRRLDDNSGRVLKAPRTVPLPAKHPPVDLTPNGADIDGLMRRLAAVKTEQEGSPDREKDDLKRISGIGPKLERLLHDNDIFNFSQIAEWQDADIQAMDKLLPAFHGRIQREDWVGQASKLRDARVAASTRRSN